MICDSIKKIVTYAIRKKLIEPEDEIYTVNRFLEALCLDSYEDSGDVPQEIDLEETLNELCNFAAEKGMIENSIVNRDLFDTKLMGLLTPPPSYVIRKFRSDYAESPQKATDEFYTFCGDVDYIRRYRVIRDLKWSVDSAYGKIDISINLSKPEKDPKAIAAAKSAKQVGYPKCQLCRENEGYAGRLNAPARQNHRYIPITVNGSPWNFQYSPYVYYNEHCIVFNSHHIPMQINGQTFRKLLDFVRQFPHYFVGSNADLPIVGGSILTHDHFQGGRYEFAMAKAPTEHPLLFNGFEDVEAGIVKWPLSTIRLTGKDSERVALLADKILDAWRSYSDEDAFIFAESDGEPHNTITPIARFRDGKYELDLVLRNNITTIEHPLGVYHPHEELHHIKKENIGLIEVMGLAVLPSRLKDEMAAVAEAILTGKSLEDNDKTKKHAAWVASFADRYSFTEETVMDILKEEIGKVFVRVLEDAGVYKCTKKGREAFLRFTDSIH